MAVTGTPSWIEFGCSSCFRRPRRGSVFSGLAVVALLDCGKDIEDREGGDREAKEIDAVVLLDSQDWMAPDEIRALWDAIDRTGSDAVRVIFRTAGAESPVESPELAPLRQIWRRDEERSEIGFELDRSGIYGGFHCYVRR